MDVVSDLKDIWFLVGGLVALVAWSVRLESLVKGVEQRLNILSSMMSPTKLEDHHKNLAKLETHIEYLRRDIDDIRKAGM